MFLVRCVLGVLCAGVFSALCSLEYVFSCVACLMCCVLRVWCVVCLTCCVFKFEVF